MHINTVQLSMDHLCGCAVARTTHILVSLGKPLHTIQHTHTPQLSMDRINEIFSAVALVRARPSRRLRSAAGGEGGEGGARPQSRGGPMESMEWTGLTAAQIIRLSTSQFAYTGGCACKATTHLFSLSTCSTTRCQA